MTALLLLPLVVAPVVPGTIALARAFRRKDRRWARLAIRWAVVTAMVAGLLWVVTCVRVFSAVAAVDPSQKTRFLSEGLAVVLPAVRAGAVLACALGLLGGVARGLAPAASDRSAWR
ncbi:MAG TPA: hypothetical protein VKZ18_08580 [Polyangia bacterium]|nr:hypothetical protein [Polyangia bacterium]